ncbi:MaoC/PaaZ C-terminal domain-containing protein [Nakamurella deserti]|uniref:MaoC/PaaZ C-terminal domain-containing protein n=1 Tax=Nakamurella deserti TaxID=2164074 RepID=UPI000DBE7B25|nr:MaoC/PaaZ C-terminal domain-containing protein [Nakamurella deserti]
MTTTTAASSPRLGPLFVRAALTARGRRPGPLPGRRVAVDGLAVDRAALADYARLCGFPVDDVLPVTYPHLLAFPLQAALMTGRDFPLALPGLVHVRNRIGWHRPLKADETLDITVWAADLAAHRSGTAVDLHAAVTVGGVPVWESVSTYLARGVTAPAGTPEPAAEPDTVAPTRTVAVWRLPADTGRRYAAVSGDVNPIHLTAVSARAFGFRRAIAHGMGTAARVVASLQGRTPDAGSFDVGFRKPVYLPSTVALATAPRDDGWDVAVSDRGSGTLHLVGTVRAG